MAASAAVPGVDPSRVSTPDELAACLDGLRRRRGLSYEAMEAAARLPSRSGKSRLEPLPKSTVGEIVTGKRLPTRGKLLTFLAVCEVAPADLAQWLAAWERARTADLARPAGGVRVRDARPRLLGVHDAIQVDEKVPGELPVYVLRDIDEGLRAELAANARRGCFVLLIGGPSVGKTRTSYEAVMAALPDWWLVHPADPAEVTALAQAPLPRTVVWLDELQCYLDGEHGLTGAVVRALLTATHPVVIIGTLWPDRYTAYTALPALRGADPYARERQVLDMAAVIRIDPEFSPAEKDRAAPPRPATGGWQSRWSRSGTG
jgi:Helix-turn-helix domain